MVVSVASPARGSRWSLLIRVAAAMLAALALGSPASPAAPDLFDQIHARTMAAEATRHTIRARFTQTTVSSLLVKPMVSKGTLVGEKPDRLLMTYTAPERKTILMDGKQVVITRPDRPTERVDVTDIVKKVNHYFVNATPNDLRKSFVVGAFVDPDVPGTYQIDLVPTRKQIKQGLERLQVWVTMEPLLLSQIKITFAGGDTDTIRIEEVELNVPLPPNTFAASIPPSKGPAR